LIRNFEFSFFIAAILALAPAIGLKVLHFNSSELGLLFACKGAGSVIAALFILSWVRKVFPRSVLTLSNSVIALVYLVMPCLHEAPVFFLAAAFAGAGWTVSASQLWVVGLQVIPDWARGVLFSITTLLTTGYGLMKRFAGPSAKISAVLPAKNFSGNKTEVNRPETPGAEILSNRMKPVIG
jgi:hypothetical protein